MRAAAGPSGSGSSSPSSACAGEAVILDVDGTLCDVRAITHHGYGSDRWHTAIADCPPVEDVVRAAYEAHDADQAVHGPAAPL